MSHQGTDERTNQRRPRAGETWRHARTDTRYEIVHGRAVMEINLSEAVVYSDGSTTWVRPLAEFLDRFFVDAP